MLSIGDYVTLDYAPLGNYEIDIPSGKAIIVGIKYDTNDGGVPTVELKCLKNLKRKGY